MATITAGEFRNGKTFEMDGKVMQVVEFQHVKPGKGAAFVRTKMKNVVTGAVTETSFNPTAKFEEAFVERKDMEYKNPGHGGQNLQHTTPIVPQNSPNHSSGRMFPPLLCQDRIDAGVANPLIIPVRLTQGALTGHAAFAHDRYTIECPVGKVSRVNYSNRRKSKYGYDHCRRVPQRQDL